jgi:hypothetical protein
MNLALLFDRTINRTFWSCIGLRRFLPAGTVAPLSVRRQMIEVFQVVVGNYRGLAGALLQYPCRTMASYLSSSQA